MNTLIPKHIQNTPSANDCDGFEPYDDNFDLVDETTGDIIIDDDNTDITTYEL